MIIIVTKSLVIENQFLPDLILEQGQMVYLDDGLCCDEEGNHFDLECLEGQFRPVETELNTLH